jgi:hypothetical protein
LKTPGDVTKVRLLAPENNHGVRPRLHLCAAAHKQGRAGFKEPLGRARHPAEQHDVLEWAGSIRG